MSGELLQVFMKESDGSWQATGRSGASPDPTPDTSQFTRFTALDVFNEVKIPLGSQDGGVKNVGHRIADASLSNYAGTITLTSTSDIKGLNITGPIVGRGGKITDCVIRGYNSPHDTVRAAMIGTSYDFGGAVFEWITVDLSGRESMYQDCIQGGGYTMRYSELRRGVDGLGFNRTGKAIVEMCRIYNNHYESWWNASTGAIRTATFVDYGGRTIYYPFDNASHYDTHSDACQAQAYSGWVVRGCHIGGTRATSASTVHLDPTVQADWDVQQLRDGDLTAPNAALQLNARATLPAMGFLAEYNILRGGASRCTFDSDGADNGAGVIIRHNLFERDGGGYMFRLSTGHAVTLLDNLYRDTRTAIPTPGTSADSVLF